MLISDYRAQMLFLILYDTNYKSIFCHKADRANDHISILEANNYSLK